MQRCIVGFDTSNYTTSVAACTADERVVINLKMPLSVREGERGLRQSDAVFEHVRNLPVLMTRFSELLLEKQLLPSAVGVSTRPRDVGGSYMPCFLVGLAAANSFAAARHISIHEFSHQSGHVMAALHSSCSRDRLMGYPFLAFHVSGGTTELLLVEPWGRDFRVRVVGETDDINAGQAIDRVGVALGLTFPCGRDMEHLASAYSGKIYRHPVCVRNGRCSLSGVENIALRLWKETGDAPAVAAFVFDFVCRTLIEMGEQVQKLYGEMPVLFAGGVMSNHWMRARLSERFDAYFAQPEFSADNAAGIALLCRHAIIL